MIRTASYPSLEARVAFVTGGGSGIGASIVEHLCAQRARVAFVDIERTVSETLVKTIEGRGIRRRRSFRATCATSRRSGRRSPTSGPAWGRSGYWSTTPPTTSATRSRA